MKQNTPVAILFLLMAAAILVACQKIDVPKDAQVIELPPPKYMDELSNHVGEFVSFFSEIEIPYSVTCTEEINGDDACPLHLTELEHMVNIIAGLNKNNISYSGKIIFSDGSSAEADWFGKVPARITGLVKECKAQNFCTIDVYQLDVPSAQ